MLAASSTTPSPKSNALSLLCVRAFPVAKALHREDADELPPWAEPLHPLAISWGIARWLFNGLSYELPQVDAKVLPASPRYVAHFEWLVQQSKARTMQNRS